jgi:hypothetical protein
MSSSIFKMSSSIYSSGLTHSQQIYRPVIEWKEGGKSAFFATISNLCQALNSTKKELKADHQALSLRVKTVGDNARSCHIKIEALRMIVDEHQRNQKRMNQIFLFTAVALLSLGAYVALRFDKVKPKSVKPRA